MAYFNTGFPATYQPLYQMPPAVPQPAPQPQAQGNGIIWVQGEAAAKSYLVGPNSTVQLWDSEEKVIYLKSADPSGMPSMKILDYTIRGDEPAKLAPAEEYATKKEVEALADKIRDMRDEIAGLGRRRRTAKGDEIDE